MPLQEETDHEAEKLFGSDDEDDFDTTDFYKIVNDDAEIQENASALERMEDDHAMLTLMDVSNAMAWMQLWLQISHHILQETNQDSILSELAWSKPRNSSPLSPTRLPPSWRYTDVGRFWKPLMVAEGTSTSTDWMLSICAPASQTAHAGTVTSLKIGDWPGTW